MSISYEHRGDWVPIEWMADQDFTPSMTDDNKSNYRRSDR